MSFLLREQKQARMEKKQNKAETAPAEIPVAKMIRERAIMDSSTMISPTRFHDLKMPDSNGKSGSLTPMLPE